MRIAICDDDISLNKKLYRFIEDTYKDIDMGIDLYHSGEQFLNKVLSKKPEYDLLLLDIEMDGMDGMSVAAKLKEQAVNTHIVFITSHDEFALSGYEVSAFRFLVKPIQAPKLLEAIEAVKKERSDQRTLQIQNRDQHILLHVKDIIYLEAQDKQVRFVLQDRTVHDRNGIDFYAEQLVSDDFYRIHRSYLVNMNDITFIDKLHVRVSNGDSLPVSRLRKKAFDDSFQKFVKRTAR